MRSLVLALPLLTACGDAPWACVDEQGDLYREGTMSCADWQDRGDQLLAAEEAACDDDVGDDTTPATCQCGFVVADVTCSGESDD